MWSICPTSSLFTSNLPALNQCPTDRLMSSPACKRIRIFVKPIGANKQHRRYASFGFFSKTVGLKRRTRPHRAGRDTMKRVQFALFLTLLMLCSVLSGCFGEEEKTAPSEPSPFDFDREIPSTTWYHYAGGVNALNASEVQAANITANLTGDNAPYWTAGSYYGICLLYTSPSPRDGLLSRMPSSA